MSQKTSKRSRQRAGEDVSKSFKTPGSSAKNKDDTNSKHESSDEEFCLKGFSNGNSKSEGTNGNDSASRVIQTRSRSSTPLNKTKNDDLSGELEKSNGDQLSESSFGEVINLSEAVYEEVVTELDQTGSIEEMPPLVLEKDDTVSDLGLSKDATLPDILLDQDANVVLDIVRLVEDNDSGSITSENSSKLSRTPRSDNATVGSPKTPKITVEDVDGPEPTAREIDEASDSQSSISTDNISTQAVVGSDVTRNADITYQEQDITSYESPETTYTSPSRSINDSYRNISSRRSIRPTNNDYRKFALKNTLNSEFEFEKITLGIKRKNRSSSPDNSKRFKDGLLSYFTSPITSIQNTFSKSSTPKLVSYEKKDGEFASASEEVKIEDAEQNGHLERKWCSIM